MKPLHLLYERPNLPYADLGQPLGALYDGHLGLPGAAVYANFVASVDGVVALPGTVESGQLVSAGNEADRFVMALLRAFADVVMVGAGTFRRGEGDLWFPESAAPEEAAAMRELRRRLGLRQRPVFGVVSGSGVIDPAQPALEGAVIITSPEGELRLRGLVPKSATVAVLEEKPLAPQSMLQVLRQMGFQRILVEGGPTLLGHFLRADLLDELFLTTSPRLFGRGKDGARKGLLEGSDVGGRPLELLSLRRHGSYLFARYAARPTAAAG